MEMEESKYLAKIYKNNFTNIGSRMSESKLRNK